MTPTKPVVKQKPRGRIVKPTAEQVKQDAAITEQDKHDAEVAYDDADLIAMLEAKQETANA
jgi:hypothetical protein